MGRQKAEFQWHNTTHDVTDMRVDQGQRRAPATSTEIFVDAVARFPRNRFNFLQIKVKLAALLSQLPAATHRLGRLESTLVFA